MEYRKYLEDVSQLADTIVVLTVISLVAVPTAYRIGDSTVSLALASLSILTTSGAIILSWFNLKKSKNFKQYRARLLATIAIPSVMLVISTVSALSTSAWAINTLSSPEVKATTIEAREVSQDPELLATLRAIGAKGDYQDLSLVIHASDMSRPCELSSSLACYRKDSTGSHSITISKQAYQYGLTEVTAHEFLHFAWQKNDLEKDKVLTSHLIDLYAKQPALQEQMTSHYVEAGGLNPDEIFAHACTSLSREELGGYISNKCNSFIDTTKLISA